MVVAAVVLANCRGRCPEQPPILVHNHDPSCIPMCALSSHPHWPCSPTLLILPLLQSITLDEHYRLRWPGSTPGIKYSPHELTTVRDPEIIQKSPAQRGLPHHPKKRASPVVLIDLCSSDEGDSPAKARSKSISCSPTHNHDSTSNPEEAALTLAIS